MTRAATRRVRPAAPRPVGAPAPNLRVWIVAGGRARRGRRHRVHGVAAARQSAGTGPRPGRGADRRSRPPDKIVERADGSAPTASTRGRRTSWQSDEAAEQPPNLPQRRPRRVAAPPSAPATAQATTPGPPSSAPALPAPTAAPSCPCRNASRASRSPTRRPSWSTLRISPEKVKTYVGTVVWQRPAFRRARGSHWRPRSRPTIDIPDAKTQLLDADPTQHGGAASRIAHDRSEIHRRGRTARSAPSSRSTCRRCGSTTCRPEIPWPAFP